MELYSIFLIFLTSSLTFFYYTKFICRYIKRICASYCYIEMKKE